MPAQTATMQLQRNVPRTLPFHLTLQMLLWSHSNAALPQAKPVLPNWNGKWPNFAGIPPLPEATAFQAAVRKELVRRSGKLIKGVSAYLNHPYRRPATQAHTVWQSGTTRLLDYGVAGQEKAAVLCIPPLINRYYVMDLAPGRSMVEYLRQRGIRPFIIDWDEPGEEEATFDATAYLQKRLQPALEVVSRQTNAPIVLAGYCMGGLLGLMLAQHTPLPLAGIALLAMPWDFHVPDFPRIATDDEHANKLRELLTSAPTLPGEVLHTFFHIRDPWVFAQKFAAFADMPQHGKEAEKFVSFESWVHDSVDMAAPMASTCLLEWVYENQLAKGKWKVAGHPLNPALLKVPALVVCPQHDAVVPPACSKAIIPLLANSSGYEPDCGHVGTVAGSRAHEQLWPVLEQWINSR